MQALLQKPREKAHVKKRVGTLPQKSHVEETSVKDRNKLYGCLLALVWGRRMASVSSDTSWTLQEEETCEEEEAHGRVIHVEDKKSLRKKGI